MGLALPQCHCGQGFRVFTFGAVLTEALQKTLASLRPGSALDQKLTVTGTKDTASALGRGL